MGEKGARTKPTPMVLDGKASAAPTKEWPEDEVPEVVAEDNDRMFRILDEELATIATDFNAPLEAKADNKELDTNSNTTGEEKMVAALAAA